ncbi:hypothetical protein L360_04745 [Enterobacter sp. MGH 14]|nr:hypothetical protein L360_04745 [Enterobacter sp. MGH 14]
MHVNFIDDNDAITFKWIFLISGFITDKRLAISPIRAIRDFSPCESCATSNGSPFLSIGHMQPEVFFGTRK